MNNLCIIIRVENALPFLLVVFVSIVIVPAALRAPPMVVFVIVIGPDGLRAPLMVAFVSIFICQM